MARSEGGVLAGWLEALRGYKNPRVAAMLFLGFSSGLPFLLVFSTLSAWLTQADVSRTAIGMFSWVGLTYSIKFFWAPVVDRLRLPLLTGWLGRRRGWMLVAQVGIASGLLILSSLDPATTLTPVALAALLVAFSSATQDIVIDAWRIEAAPQSMQGEMAAAYQLGYRVALIVAGAGALFAAAELGWATSYFIMACCVGVGFVTTLVIPEPQTQLDRSTVAREQRVVDFLANNEHLPKPLRDAGAWFTGAVVCPFVDFFSRNGLKIGVVILLFVGLYRLTDITMGVMANPFYLDMGYSLEQVAAIAKGYGVIMSIIGVLVGGVLVARIGAVKSLIVGGVCVMLANLCFAFLAHQEGQHPSLIGLAAVISADNLSGAVAGTAFIAYLSGLTNTAYTATQYALFSSLFTLPGKLLAGGSGWVVEHFGYTTFFIYTSSLGLPALLLVIYLSRHVRLRDDKGDDADAVQA